MATPLTRVRILGEKQRQQKQGDDGRFKGGVDNISQTPVIKGLSEKLRFLPASDKIKESTGGDRKKIDLLFSMRESFSKNDIPDLQQSICDHVEYRCARMRWNFDLSVGYESTALSVRDRMIELWNDTNETLHEKKPKRLYYLSIEFLIGRLLRSNVLSLGLEDQYSRALKEIGLSMEEVGEQEVDMALGNGGLGRLAACFLDSMASLSLPAWGYGLRYQYGMFKQRISNEGDQVELPDYWLENGCPWEIQRNDVKYRVNFYGGVKEKRHFETLMHSRKERRPKRKQGKGGPETSPPTTTITTATTTTGEGGVEEEEYEEVEVIEPAQVEVRPPTYTWTPGQVVVARAYDVPIAGFDTLNVINLRLWESLPDREFDFSSFNKGSYDEAVRSKQNAELITQVLYPNDSFISGKELRLKQQYLFVSASLQDILGRFLETHNGDLSLLPTQVILQCNDTHPVLAIPELMRLLMDEHEQTFEAAWALVQGCFAYTNHTVLPEALEKWPVDLLQNVLPRHLQIIYGINFRFLEWVTQQEEGRFVPLLSELSIVEEHPMKQIRMANLAIITSKFVNGVAALHSDLLKETIFRHFYEVYPAKFLNVTNGVTQRRWLLESNPPLAQLYTEATGSRSWTVRYKVLKDVEKKIDADILSKLIQARVEAKQRLAVVIQRECGVTVDIQALFDVQVKRLHEYKRQTLNIIRCVYEYLRLLSLGEECEKVPKKVVIFGGKAAPGYFMAKKTIRLISAVGTVVNKDERIHDRLKVVFIPNYNVSLAQIIVPAADISQHISTAGYEASGTSCMKFCMNGALLLGTWDGANIEIMDEIGHEQGYLFGLKASEVSEARAFRVSPEFKLDIRLNNALTQIEKGMFGPASEFAPITQSTRNNDHYLIASDFADYVATHEQIEKDWQEEESWFRRALLTSLRMGKFSSDRSIIEYSQKIWDIKPCKVPKPIPASVSVKK